MDDRIRKSNGAGRESRAVMDKSRGSADEALASAPTRRRRFQSEFTQEALPTVHGDPNWHYCWLSTTNQYDTIHSRMRLGYQAVMCDELAGFEHLKVKEGEHVGHISCNEMILYKLPMDVYQDWMAEKHHYQPMEEAGKIKVQQEQLLSSARDSNGKSLIRAEGDLLDGEKDIPAPVFE